MHILLIDDHPLFRQGFMLLLSGLADDLTFVEADSVEQALDHAPAADEPDSAGIDLVLLDLRLNGRSGLAALAAIRAAFDAVPIVVVSSDDQNPTLIRQTIEQGASGFIPKSSDKKMLLPALRLVMAGDVYLPRQALSLQPSFDSDSAGELALSPRQREILAWVIKGASNKRIAQRLNLSEGTIKSHLSSAFRVLGVSTRTEAVYRVADLGLSLDPAERRH